MSFSLNAVPNIHVDAKAKPSLSIVPEGEDILLITIVLIQRQRQRRINQLELVVLILILYKKIFQIE